jgi:RNA polymerase sigma-70 factor, ECF subfamily
MNQSDQPVERAQINANQDSVLATILAAVLAGEHDAFHKLVRLYQGPLFGFLGRMGFSQAEAEEIAQEAYLRAWQHLAHFDPSRARFVTWLFAIARNLALTELGSAARRHARVLDSLIEALPSPDLQPSEILEARQQALRLQQAIRRLSMDERSSLALAYVKELDMVSIAKLEHCSLAAIKTRLHRAKHRLREILEQDIGAQP